MTPKTFQAVVIRRALIAWRDHKIKVNTAYTPSAMLQTAGHITGKKFKRGQYDAAIASLTEWIDNVPS